jgi:hypothetical protein
MKLPIVIFMGCLLTIVGFRSHPDRPALSVSIQLLTYGLASSPDSFHQQWLYSDSTNGQLTVLIKNDSRRPIDLFTDNTSWGDPTITFLAMTPDGVVHRIVNLAGAYTANAPAAVRLQPGETWTRVILYHEWQWGDFRKVFLAAKGQIKLQAVLAQDPGRLSTVDPNLWSGSVTSKPVVASVR